MKKPWGRFGHPWPSNPIAELDLWVTPFKIEIKKIEIGNRTHNLPYLLDIQHIILYLSRKILPLLPFDSVSGGVMQSTIRGPHGKSF